jgi:opacity protein-like surface antigen
MLSFPSPSAAKELDQKNYLLLKLGAYLPNDKDMEDYNDGFNGEIYYGRYFHKNFSSEIGAGYFKSDINETYDATIKTFDILYNIKGIYRIGGIELFVGPGIGLYFSKSYFPAPGITSEWEPSFGYHVLAGASFDVASDWFLGVEGKYFWATTKDPIIPQGSAFGSHLDGIVGTATLGWRF